MINSIVLLNNKIRNLRLMKEKYIRLKRSEKAPF